MGPDDAREDLFGCILPNVLEPGCIARPFGYIPEKRTDRDTKIPSRGVFIHT